MTEVELRAYGEAFREQARGVDYLTEIALDQVALSSLLGALRGAWWRPEPGVEFALAVAAVNFAYYQEYDEGFREPFLRALTGRCDLNEWQNSIGPRLRRAIEETGHAVPETGFRYVGPVRMHAGLSFARLPAYAKLIADLRFDPGWPATRCAPRKQLTGTVQRHFANSKAAEEFLIQPQGIDFLRATCDVLAMHREGYLSVTALDAQPGFRTGFFSRLLELLEQLGAGVQSGSAGRGAPASAPRLVLDPESLQLFLRFDPEQVARRAITCDQSTSRIYRPKMPLGPDLPPSNLFSGTRNIVSPAGEKTETAWEAEGWSAGGNDWAVFTEEGSFIAARRDLNDVEIDAGRYLLACDVRLNFGDGPFATALGSLEVGGISLGCDYRVYHLDLSQQGTSQQILPGLRLVCRERGAPTLEPVGGQSWSRLSDFDVVWSGNANAVPAVNLHGWTPDAALRYRIMVKVGDTESVLNLPHQRIGEDGPICIPLDKLPMPSMGRMWLQPIGRRNSGHPSAELVFARFPSCDVSVPPALYENRDRPEVVFDVPIGVEVKCDADRARSDVRGGCTRVTYRSHPETIVHGAELSCGPVSIDMRLPIHRARLRERARPHVPLVLDEDFLRKMQHAHLSDGVAGMEVTALPNSQATLSLRTRDGKVVELTSKALGPSGSAPVAVNEILDALAGCDREIARFSVTTGTGYDARQDVMTDSWFIGSRFDFISLDAKELEELPQCVADPVRLIHASQQNKPCLCNVHTATPLRLARLAGNWHGASVVLDGQPPMSGLQGAIDPAVWSELLRIQELLRKVRTLDLEVDSAGRANAWVEAYDQLDPVKRLQGLGLGLQRWETLLSESRIRASERADVARRLGDFVMAIRSGGVLPEGVPSLLEQASLNYLRAEGSQGRVEAQAFLKGATRQLLDLKQLVGVPPFWLLVGDALLPLAFLRQARISHALSFIGSYPQAIVCSKELQAIAVILQGDPVSMQNAANSTNFSPRRDDELICAALGDSALWPQVAEVCWLGAWLGWRRAALAGDDAGVQNTLRQAAMRHRDQIPASLERPSIWHELDAGVPAKWVVARKVKP